MSCRNVRRALQTLFVRETGAPKQKKNAHTPLSLRVQNGTGGGKVGACLPPPPPSCKNQSSSPPALETIFVTANEEKKNQTTTNLPPVGVASEVFFTA